MPEGVGYGKRGASSFRSFTPDTGDLAELARRGVTPDELREKGQKAKARELQLYLNKEVRMGNRRLQATRKPGGPKRYGP